MGRMVVSGLLVVLAGCSGDPPTVTPAPPTADPLAGPTALPGAKPLTIELLNTELALGLERIGFRLKDAGGGQVRDGAVNVTYYRILSQTGGSARQATGQAVYFGAGLPDGGKWVVYTEFDASGPWDMQVQVTGAGGTLEGRTRVDVIGRTRTPATGHAPPSGDTPVAGASGNLEALTTDASPEPALYQQSVEQARTSGKPSVVYFGSPANCPTSICQATLDEVKAVRATVGDRANFIHVETLDPAQPANQTPAAAAWGVDAGPWLFVIGKRGLISARAEGAIDRTELQLLVERALGE